MDRLLITGGRRLSGEVELSGAKNAALPLMAACLLSKEPLTLTHVPHLADVASLVGLLAHLGVSVHMDGQGVRGHTGHRLMLNAATISSHEAPYELVRKMRASVLVLGPLVAHHGEAIVSLPGGCAIGTRPIDLHLMALEAMGAEIELKEGYIHARRPGKRLKGADIHFDKVSVGATENALMAASLADGTTRLRNAAREPEITDLANCLNAMGARISGIGSDCLVIEGVENLHKAEHVVLPDRIELGSFIVAAGITGGEALIHGGSLELLGSVADKLRAANMTLQEEENALHVKADSPIRSVDVDTHPYPEFATDMQAQFMTLMCLADGVSTIRETIFENRFMHVPELTRMGANIKLNGNIALIQGVEKLSAANVMATDLRASMSLILAALAAEGETPIHRVYHLDRGYERIEEKLGKLGADIRRAN
ncbi:UDP-N-acetylglucosamine 1-carboxyvinyltransferase [bacterium]|nr:UDP-N-acetylglucosamine 1-carboxyvinyltransferase [bacterium]